MITTDPLICSGRPCIAGTRIPASAIKSFHAAGCDTAEIMREYPGITAEQIAAALAYEPPVPDLAPCRFCGSALVQLIATGLDEQGPAVTCLACGVVVSGSGFDVERVVAVWNGRAA